jgi:hypothetical protein
MNKLAVCVTVDKHCVPVSAISCYDLTPRKPGGRCRGEEGSWTDSSDTRRVSLLDWRLGLEETQSRKGKST